MQSIVSKAIESVQHAKVAYCKFITPNDTGDTGGHQAGYHIHKNAWPLMFDSPGEKGANKDNFVTIKWQNDFETSSRFIYYGVGTRDEYRLTRFGKGFPFVNPDTVGDLLVLARHDEEYYEAFVLGTDDDTEDFLSSFGISPRETNRIIEKEVKITSEQRLLQCFEHLVRNLSNFPSTEDLALNARRCYMQSFDVPIERIMKSPDAELLRWVDAEYQLFKTIESVKYRDRINRPFETVEELVGFANTILNRRKSRAGKSLEHHLSSLFQVFGLSFSSQCTTEDNKKPDFIFPNIESYHQSNFNQEKLTFLASKTTCKDRWRQILNEADRIEIKHLFTLQQSISRNQLEEMYKYGVRLVVPAEYIRTFPNEFRERILSMDSFMKLVRSREG